MKYLGKIGILMLVALLMIGLALPAAAKGGPTHKGGRPDSDSKPRVEKIKSADDATSPDGTAGSTAPAGTSEAAGDEQSRAKGKDKANPGQAINEAQALAKQGKIDEALALLDGLAESGKDAKVLKVMAEMLVEKGDRKAAIKSLEEALEGASEDGSLYERLRSLFREAGDDGIKVYVKGKKPAFDVRPQIVGGRTMVPFRVLAEAMGAKVAWDPESSTITIFRGRTVLKLTLGNAEAEVNGVQITLDAPASVINGRTMVPLRFIGEVLNATVEYDPETKMIVIKDATTEPAPAPAEGTTAPATETTAPTTETTAPTTDTTAPTTDTTAPTTETTAPTTDTTAPATETTAPTTETTAPTTETTTPAAGN